MDLDQEGDWDPSRYAASCFDEDAEGGLSSPVYCTEPSSEPINSIEDALVRCIPSSVRFHGKPLIDVLRTRAEEARYQGYTADTGPAPLLSLCLSSSMLDADKLRRVWPLGGVFCLLQTLDLSGNLIHALEPSQLSGLTQLRELNLARNRLRSLRGIDVLAGSLVCLDAGGNLVESLSDKGVHRCRLLEALDLSGNNLRSPQDVQGLSGLPHLTRLDLRVNPVSNAPSSRLFAVFHLRSVAVLDATPVTEAERQAAHARYGDLSMEVVQEAMRKQDEAAKKCLGAATASAEELRRENDRLRVELRVKSRLLHNATGSASQAREELMMLQDRMEGLCMGGEGTHIQRLPPSTTQATAPSPLALCAAPVPLLEGPTSEPRAPLAHMLQAEATSPVRRTTDVSPVALLPPPPPPPLPSSPAPPTAALASPFPHPIEVLVNAPAVLDVPPSEDGPSMEVLWASPVKPRHPTPPSRLRHYATEAGGGTEAALASPADDWMLSTQVPSAEELDEAQADLRTQRQGLREQIHTKRSQLGRVRGCLSVLGQQLHEARKEAGDDLDDESPAASPLKTHARHKADHRGLQGRQAVLEEKRGAHRKLSGHMEVLEQRLTCLRTELSRRTAAFVAGVGTVDKGSGEAASGPACGLPYEEALVELSKEVELTQDEVSKVAGQLCRLQSEMEALGGQLTGRVDHSYLAPSSPLKTAQARKGAKTAGPWGLSGAAPASPMLLRTSLSELEEGGGRLRRFAAEGSAEFILRLRQRLTAAKLLEDKVQTELDQLERELDQVGRILAQLQRQRLQQELALARQESRISQQQVRALLRALQQAQSSDDVEAVAAQQRQHEAHRREKEQRRRRDEDETQRRELQHTGLLHDQDADLQGSRTTAHVATCTADEDEGEGAGEERRVGEGQGSSQSSPAPAGRAHAATATSPTLLHTRQTGFSTAAAEGAQRGHRGTTSTAATAQEQRRPAPLDMAPHSAAAAREECGPPVGGNGGGPLDLSPRSCYMHLRALQQQLDEARDREEMVHETGIAVDRRSRTPLGRLEVTVVRTGGWRLGGGRPHGEGVGGGPYYLTITMDPITSCFGRTGAFGSHPAGSYLFRTSSQREERHGSRPQSSATSGHGGSITWNDKFVVKPVLSRQALLKLVLMDEAPTRAGRRRDVAVGEAFVPLVSLLDQRPHLFWLPLTPPEQTTGSKRKHPSSSNPSLHHTATPQHDASQSASNAVCSLRVRVRFEYSRAALLEDRLEQIAHTVQARGYDLHEVEREVLEEDAFRHAMGQHTTHDLGPSHALSPIPHHNTSAFFAHDDPLPPPPQPPPQRRLTPRKAAADRYAGPPIAKAMRGPGGHKAPTALASSLLSTTTSSFLATHRGAATPSPTPHATTAGDTDAEPPSHAHSDPASSTCPPAPASPPRPPSRPMSVDGRSPCVLSSLYSSLSHLQSVAQSAKLASSTPQRRLPSPALTRPHAADCFDADSPYHPRPVLQPSPARAPSPLMPSYLLRRAAAAAARREDENTPGSANGRRFARLADTRGRTPPPPPDVLSEGGSRELSLHDPRPIMDSTSHWPRKSPANLTIFKDPAVRRQPNTRDLDKSMSSLIPGRLIGIDTRETRWRQEMCKRFASTT